MVRDRFPPEPWRRGSDDFDSRGNAPPRRSRDDSRGRARGDDNSYDDRGRDRRDWADRDKDRGRGRDRDDSQDEDRERSRERLRSRDFDRDFGRDYFDRVERERGPKEPPIKSPLNGAPRRKPFIGAPIIPKGPKTGQTKSPYTPRPGQQTPNGPRTPLKLDTRGFGAIASPRLDETRDRDSLSQLVVALLKKSRELGEHEHDKDALDLIDKRREELKRSLSRNSDFPSLPELHRHMSEAERDRREAAAKTVDRTTGDLSALSKSFVSQLFAKTQQDVTMKDLVQSLKTKQEQMEAKLEGQAVRKLEEENAKLRENVTKLTSMVDSLNTRVTAMADTSTRLDTQVGRLSAREITQTSTIEGIETKLVDHGQALARIKAADLEAMNGFLATDKPRLQDDLDKQKAAVARLQTEMVTVQSDSQAAIASQPQPQLQTQQQQQTQIHGEGLMPVLGASPHAPTAANLTPAPTPAMVFPGDDFASLRIEIGMLNERMVPLEAAPEKIERLSVQQTRTAAKNYVDMKNMKDAQKAMAEAFGGMLNKAAEARKVDSERLMGLEKSVLQLQHSPSALPSQNAAAISSKDIDTSETALGPFLSPIPEPPAELLVQQTAAAASPPAVEQSTNEHQVAALTLTGKAQPPSGGVATLALETSFQMLQERIKLAEVGIETNQLNVDGQFATIKLMVSALDTQFNNLTTKDLYNAIVGHLEKLYPNARQLQQDVENMSKQVRSIEQHNRGTDETIRRMAEAMAVPVGQKRSLAGGSSNGGPVTDASTAKRRKINGAAPPENGNAGV